MIERRFVRSNGRRSFQRVKAGQSRSASGLRSTNGFVACSHSRLQSPTKFSTTLTDARGDANDLGSTSNSQRASSADSAPATANIASNRMVCARRVKNEKNETKQEANSLRE